MEENVKKELGSDVNRRKFVLVTNPNAKFEDYGQRNLLKICFILRHTNQTMNG